MTTGKTFSIVFLAILLTTSVAFAEIKPEEFSVTPFAGEYMFDNDLYLENAMGYGARMGYNLDKHWAVEGSFGYSKTKLNSEAVILYRAYRSLDLLGLAEIEIGQLNDSLLSLDVLNSLVGLDLIDEDLVESELFHNELLDLGLLDLNNLGLLGTLAPILDTVLGPLLSEEALAAIDYDVDAEVFNYNLDVLYHFSPEKKLVPFLAAGAGGTTIKFPEGIKDKNEFSLNFGGGAKYFVNDKMSVRCDARNITMLGSDMDNIQEISVGLSFLFGQEKKEQEKNKTPAMTAVRDSDEDGVPDYLDKCPKTPKDVKVDKYGCPLDGDGDGIPNYLDKSPSTPKGVVVGPDGCPLDSDKDGVPDYIDKSPKTPKGAKVDERGVWSFQADDVLFDFDKYVLKPQAYPILDDAVGILKRDKKLRLEVRGHTCNIGTEEYNKKLSEQRARAVVDYLISKGINSKRLEYKGYGETMPAYSNDTEEQRIKNRRVEFIPIN
jgi:OOP family OmpA-OmpF porin